MSIVTEYIGKPYDIEGDNGYNCFTLVAELCKRLNNFDFDRHIDVRKREITGEMIAEYRAKLRRIDEPKEGCLVLMNRGNHVGYVIGGRVLHAHRVFGVVYQAIETIQGRKEYYEVNQ